MAEEMTKIEIVTRQSMLEPLKDALNDIGINGMTVYNVLGYGVQKGQKHKYRGVDYSVDLLPKIKIEMVVCTVPVDDVVNTALSVLRTGEIGDGKIFISPVQKVIKVRTGETDKAALL
jgi:nitrogen regulatory protein PII